MQLRQYIISITLSYQTNLCLLPVSFGFTTSLTFCDFTVSFWNKQYCYKLL